MERWPRLFAGGKHKNCAVRDRIKEENGSTILADIGAFSADSVESISELQELQYMLSQVSVSGNKDRWLWDSDESKSFSVAAVKERLRRNRYGPMQQFMKWESWVPIKVNMLMWRIEKDRIPTRKALVRRQVNIPDPVCPMCEVYDESITHLMIECGFADGMWVAVLNWCKIRYSGLMTVEELLQIQDHMQVSKWGKKIIRGIVMIACWALWKERNKKVFDGSSPRVVEVVASVKCMSFLWFKHRSRYKNCGIVG
ncbi:uncharacterized protein LOC110880476 [Helianthus annuus]|uniref:uncharacterized protein LOC110880476 n=1 Tax=Helianthus annuus TaxID=4232 RepID=UPI001652CEAD|nr:uncharacterized protein LOC110880476 [Helianthus annuus]